MGPVPALIGYGREDEPLVGSISVTANRVKRHSSVRTKEKMPGPAGAELEPLTADWADSDCS